MTISAKFDVSEVEIPQLCTGLGLAGWLGQAQAGDPRAVEHGPACLAKRMLIGSLPPFPMRFIPLPPPPFHCLPSENCKNSASPSLHYFPVLLILLRPGSSIISSLPLTLSLPCTHRLGRRSFVHARCVSQACFTCRKSCFAASAWGFASFTGSNILGVTKS